MAVAGGARIGRGFALASALSVIVVMLGVGAAAHAGAAPAPTTTNISQSELDQCVGSAPIGIDPPPSCTFDANGHLISRSQAPSPSPIGAPSSSSSSLLPLLFLALIWSAVPFLIAVSIARSRGEPVGTAVLLTLVLGWIGLLIVIYGQRRTATDVGRWLNPNGEPAPAPRPAARTTPTGGTRSTPERLRTIDQLYAEGSITTEEHRRGRAAIADQHGTVSERLRTIDQLYAEGSITTEEHQQRRAAILDEV